ncbi:MAG: serine/threonine-protein kinase [Polyangia bacterium]
MLDRAVAIKFIAAVSPDEGVRQRFMREARAIARLLHPNVVTVHSVGQVDGRPYLVTELVRGRSLAQLERPLSGERVLSIAIDLCRGLAAAHRRGVLHRDLKPANAIDSDEGTVKLLDFGLAKLVSRQRTHGSQPEITDAIDPTDTAEFPPTLLAASVTQRGMLIGTPLYIAPEIWLGQPASVQTDLYSLGAVLYELSTGIPPAHAGSLAELRRKVLAGGIPACSSLAAAMDARLAQAIDRCLARDPVARPRSAEDMLQDLLRIQPQHTRRPPDGNPFRGLHVFHAEHRAVFFGRESDLTEALERLRTQSLLVLLGDSGVGKSSLAYAAILPDVESGALADGLTFQTISLAPGADPQMALATALSRTMAWPVATLCQQIGEEPAALARAIQERLANDTGLLVFIDQLEELVTTAQPDAARRTAEFLGQLALGWPGLRVLASLRADFLTRIGALPALGRMLPASVQMILPLDRCALRMVMTEPLRQKGYAFESEAMIDEILDAVPGDGGLPLLQFSLSVLWDLRDSAVSHCLFLYWLKIGGLTGALAHHSRSTLGVAVARTARRGSARLVQAGLCRRHAPCAPPNHSFCRAMHQKRRAFGAGAGTHGDRARGERWRELL